LKCPHCEKPIPGVSCPECGLETPEGGRYCMSCGALLIVTEEDPVENGDGFDLENRELCPDGACTGIVVEGRCTECGRAVKGGRFVKKK